MFRAGKKKISSSGSNFKYLFLPFLPIQMTWKNVGALLLFWMTQHLSVWTNLAEKIGQHREMGRTHFRSRKLNLQSKVKNRFPYFLLHRRRNCTFFSNIVLGHMQCTSKTRLITSVYLFCTVSSNFPLWNLGQNLVRNPFRTRLSWVYFFVNYNFPFPVLPGRGWLGRF